MGYDVDCGAVNENITTRTAHSEALIVSGTGYDVDCGAVKTILQPVPLTVKALVVSGMGYDVDCGAMKTPRPLALVLERVWNTAVVGIPSGNDTAAQRNEWPHGMTQAAGEWLHGMTPHSYNGMTLHSYNGMTLHSYNGE